MPSYRFCRPDDIPYLVRAVGECYDVHFRDAPAMTLERFRAEMKSLDLWPSNCMVASSDDGPVAVLIGTKRAEEVLVLRIGVRADHQRQSHGVHLLTSLSQKLAVLGPERLIAEVPRNLPGLADFMAAAGYRREVTYTDSFRAPAPVEPVPEGLVTPVSVRELEGEDVFEISPDVAWSRRHETLLAGKDELEGVAIVTPERIEAFALHHPAVDGSGVDVVAAIAAPGQRRELFTELLLRHLITQTGQPLRCPRLLPGEVPDSVLAKLGFEPGIVYDRWAATATPA